MNKILLSSRLAFIYVFSGPYYLKLAWPSLKYNDWRASKALFMFLLQFWPKIFHFPNFIPENDQNKPGRLILPGNLLSCPVSGFIFLFFPGISLSPFQSSQNSSSPSLIKLQKHLQTFEWLLARGCLPAHLLTKSSYFLFPADSAQLSLQNGRWALFRGHVYPSRKWNQHSCSFG